MINASVSSLESRIQRRMAAGCREFGLIADGDHILVGLSGGKDSLTLLDMLGRRQRIRVPSIRVEALHVRMRDIKYESDTEYLQRFAREAGVPLHIRETSTDGGGTADAEAADELLRDGAGRRGSKPACFLCSWNRRKELFNLAQELGCNKIALGHHQDDILMTALMNLTFQGSFATMPARLEMRRMPLAIIRPLCYVPEADIQAWADERGYVVQQKHCPYERATNRTAVASVFDAMQRLSPDARNSLWNALRREGKLVENKE